jgi:transcriptional regulator GlxA family with amidase domain
MPGPTIRFSRAPSCEEWDHRYIAFTGPGVRDLADPGDLLTRPLAVPPNRVGAIARITDDLINAARQTSEVQRLKATAILQLLLIEAAEIRGSPQRTRAPWLEQVLDALRSAQSDPGYSEIARRVGVSLPTLRRRFRETMGVPIHEYYLRMRLDTARRLLAQTKRPIKDIACELGYADVFYFTRQFTHRVGASPGVYRASAQGRLSDPSGG